MPFEVPLATVTPLPQTVIGAVAETDVPLPDTGPLPLPLPFDPVDAEAAVAPRNRSPPITPAAPSPPQSHFFIDNCMCHSSSETSVSAAYQRGRARSQME